MKFLILNQASKPTNHGTIAQRLTDERYLCQFTRIPTSCRVCHLDEIAGWNLFPTDEDMNAFITALEKKPADPPPPAPPADPPKTNGSKANAKKSKAKKTAQSKK